MSEKGGFLPLCWQNTVPSCRVENVLFPNRNIETLRVNFPEVFILSCSKTNEPKAFANHRSIFLLLTCMFACLSSHKRGATPKLRDCVLSGMKRCKHRRKGQWQGPRREQYEMKTHFSGSQTHSVELGVGGGGCSKPLLG